MLNARLATRSVHVSTLPRMRVYYYMETMETEEVMEVEEVVQKKQDPDKGDGKHAVTAKPSHDIPWYDKPRR